MTIIEQRTYSTMEVCEMTGATYRQADFWARTGRIPGQDAVIGSGHRRRWTPVQVARVGILLQASALSNATLDEAIVILERTR